jgi:hypothetical protein
MRLDSKPSSDSAVGEPSSKKIGRRALLKQNQIVQECCLEAVSFRRALLKTSHAGGPSSDRLYCKKTLLKQICSDRRTFLSQ